MFSCPVHDKMNVVWWLRLLFFYSGKYEPLCGSQHAWPSCEIEIVHRRKVRESCCQYQNGKTQKKKKKKHQLSKRKEEQQFQRSTNKTAKKNRKNSQLTYLTDIHCHGICISWIQIDPVLRCGPWVKNIWPRIIAPRQELKSHGMRAWYQGWNDKNCLSFLSFFNVHIKIFYVYMIYI